MLCRTPNVEFNYNFEIKIVETILLKHLVKCAFQIVCRRI